jgi:hypothetical protein
VNVAQDVALCRSCGKATPFSIVCGISEIDLGVLSSPQRGVQVSREADGSQKIVYRRFSPALLFLIPFTAFWSGLSIWGLYGSQIHEWKFDMEKSLMGLPFLLGTVVLLGVILFMIFGHWVITLNRGQGTVFVGVGPLGWTRKFTFNRDSIVSLKMTSIQRNDVPQKGIAVTSGEKEIVFGTTFSENAKKYIAAEIVKTIKL